MATRMLLMANSISVLLPAYRRTLMEKYSGDNVHFRAHGILSARPEPPAFEKRGNPEHRILAFGKWGTYKRLELLIEAFAEVVERFPQARLVIAGGDHPATPGYVERVAEAWRADNPYIRFTGYVEEEGSCRALRLGEPDGDALLLGYRFQRRGAYGLRVRIADRLRRHC